jgi:hypothetical protein
MDILHTADTKLQKYVDDVNLPANKQLFTAAQLLHPPSLHKDGRWKDSSYIFLDLKDAVDPEAAAASFAQASFIEIYTQYYAITPLDDDSSSTSDEEMAELDIMSSILSPKKQVW